MLSQSTVNQVCTSRSAHEEQAAADDQIEPSRFPCVVIEDAIESVFQKVVCVQERRRSRSFTFQDSFLDILLFIIKIYPIHA